MVDVNVGMDQGDGGEGVEKGIDDIPLPHGAFAADPAFGIVTADVGLHLQMGVKERCLSLRARSSD